jgi:hypothetical protein
MNKDARSMSLDVEAHVVYRIANTPIREFPFPHIFVPDVFPAAYYRELLGQLPPDERLQTLQSLGRVTGNYAETRLVMPMTPKDLMGLDAPYRAFWEQLCSWLLGGRFGQFIVMKFAPYLRQRFPDLDQRGLSDEALIVRDYTKYSLGPHTDSPSKLLSLLFYLPADASMERLGTSIYTPKQPGFVCPGGPHHDFGLFRLMQTMPYVPNALFAFMKTDNSFHGVEPITDENVRRDLVLYDIRVELTEQRPRQAAAPAASAVKFTMQS